MENKAPFSAVLMSLLTAFMAGIVLMLLLFESDIEIAAITSMVKYGLFVMFLIGFIYFLISAYRDKAIKPKGKLWLIISLINQCMFLIL